MKEKEVLRIQGTEIVEFEKYLYERENAGATIRKYLTDLKCFFKFLGEKTEIDCRATLSGSHKQHFIIANFSRKKAQSHLNDTVMPLFLHSFSSVPGY